MTTPTSATPAGFYPDPSGAPGQSYWDGTEWGAPNPPNPPEPKKSHKLRNGVLIAVGVFVALAIFGSLLPKTEDGKPASESTTALPKTTVSAAPSVQVTSTAAPSTQARPAPTDAQVEEAFQAYINERSSSGVMLAESVTSVTVTGGVVTIVLDAEPVVLELSPFDNQAELFGTPVAFNDDEGVWLRQTVQRVDVVDADGTSLGSMTAADLNKMGAG
ncbi:DUF2510 domain-containing protein [Mycobacterium antarcticum]|uniref:DUF2510 domain-containing protein n=1 Tax=Mycolicibacterium sp. TUM20984 TaxID=3023368 RepID=UPI002398BBBA|nr:DUF2510 domain-containing protein [Mycolicibacterium sp. TUM20984]GLP83643.1 hypothetical protein TUM20984_50630 [Mycolicibacterium sp. TUM20984]